MRYLREMRLHALYRFFLFFLYLPVSAFASAPYAVDPVQSGFISHPYDSSKKIEFFWTKPSVEGKWPVVILIHGHQADGERTGGLFYVKQGFVDLFAKGGMVAVAISQPGYGNSNGPPDFCGPYSQKAVVELFDHFKLQPFVNVNKLGLFGYSRGAILGSMVATQVPNLSAVILGGGIYDLKDTYYRLPPELDGIKRNIEIEAGISEQAFSDRSALWHVESVNAPTLIIHGALDDRAPVDQAELLASKLNEQGTTVQLNVYPEFGHGVPNTVTWPVVRAFLQTHLLQ